MLKTYKTYNLTTGFSKYEFYNKLLGDVTLLRVILGVTWTQPTNYLYILSANINLFWQALISGVATARRSHTSKYFEELQYMYLSLSISSTYWIFLIYLFLQGCFIATDLRRNPRSTMEFDFPHQSVWFLFYLTILTSVLREVFFSIINIVL